MARGALRVYRNPFSNAVTQPKIPDGKCRLSIGRKFQNVKEYTNDSNGVMSILLFPGIDNGLAVYGATSSGTPGDPNANPVVPPTPNQTNCKYAGHIDYVADDPVFGNQFSTITQNSSDTLSRWRIVSQGLKLTLVNNADENDGWFEAIRFAIGTGEKQYKFANSEGCIMPDNSFEIPTDVEFPTLSESAQVNASSSAMVQHPSYFSGKLRDIHKYMFKLRPHDTDHDFLSLQKQYTYSNTANGAGATNQRKDFEDANVDSSYDVMLIRIHGRPQTQGVNPTRVMAHVVCNQELMYREGTKLANMHTPSPRAMPGAIIRSDTRIK